MTSTIYFIQAGEQGPIKIGYCSSEEGVAGRLVSLQCGNPAKLVVRRIVPGDRALESELHRRFAQWRLEGEWFAPVVEVAKIAHAPDMANRDPMRKMLPWVKRAYRAGRVAGAAEMEADMQQAIRAELLALAERWWPEPYESLEEIIAQNVEDRKALERRVRAEERR